MEPLGFQEQSLFPSRRPAQYFTPFAPEEF
jgi:hypothetical protein